MKPCVVSSLGPGVFDPLVLDEIAGFARSALFILGDAEGYVRSAALPVRSWIAQPAATAESKLTAHTADKSRCIIIVHPPARA
jgi:hypothetical protein